MITLNPTLLDTQTHKIFSPCTIRLHVRMQNQKMTYEFTSLIIIARSELHIFVHDHLQLDCAIERHTRSLN